MVKRLLFCLSFLCLKGSTRLQPVPRSYGMTTNYRALTKMAYWWTKDDTSSKAEQSTKPWKFRVEYKALPGELMCVTGNCDSLGNWKNDHALVLRNESNNIWSSVANISADMDVRYRYFVCIPVGSKLIVRRWESGMIARVIVAEAPSNSESNACDTDTFGTYKNTTSVEKGWLTSEIAVQLKLVNNPIQLWKNKSQDVKISVKVTPVSLRNEAGADRGDKTPSWPLTEISVLNENESEFKLQSQFGRIYSEDEFVTFQTLTDEFETTVYEIDLYSTDDGNTNSTDPLSHLGFATVLPSSLTRGEGRVTVPISSNEQRMPIGQISFDYLVVTPLEHSSSMKITLSSQWRDCWNGLSVGHRGSGESFSCGTGCASVRENTIASFRSAGEAGADLVEFDVQLSRDLVPILYHDFYVALSTQRKLVSAGACSETLNDVIRVPVKDLTLDEMESLQLYHVKEGIAKLKRRFSRDLELDHQAFPTLQRALELIDPSIGFNIELKWTMVRADGTYELDHPIDMNTFVDTILQIVMEYAGDRNCVFSCFNPDIVTMLRLKQNKYPVMFLTQGVTSKWPQYRDPRCHNVTMGIHHARCASLLGLSVHSEDLLRDETQVAQIKAAGLMVWTWGDDANDPANVRRLKDLGVQAVINDRVVSQSYKSESVFLIDAREAAKHS